MLAEFGLTRAGKLVSASSKTVGAPPYYRLLRLSVAGKSRYRTSAVLELHMYDNCVYQELQQSALLLRPNQQVYDYFDVHPGHGDATYHAFELIVGVVLALTGPACATPASDRRRRRRNASDLCISFVIGRFIVSRRRPSTLSALGRRAARPPKSTPCTALNVASSE